MDGNNGQSPARLSLWNNPPAPCDVTKEAALLPSPVCVWSGEWCHPSHRISLWLPVYPVCVFLSVLHCLFNPDLETFVQFFSRVTCATLSFSVLFACLTSLQWLESIRVHLLNSCTDFDVLALLHRVTYVTLTLQITYYIRPKGYQSLSTWNFDLIYFLLNLNVIFKQMCFLWFWSVCYQIIDHWTRHEEYCSYQIYML